MKEKDLTKYNLTKEEYNKCLAMAEISIFMQGDTVTGKRPKSILVVAQAGAGKTGLKNFIINEGQDNGTLESYIEFNPDEIATYHEYYKQILEEFPDDSYQILQEFVRPALDTYLRQRAVQLKNNIVQEGTFGSTQGYIDLIEFQKNGGKAKIGKLQADSTREEVEVEGNYEVELNILAVDRFESYLSAQEREQYFRESNLPPRVVILKNHDYAYEKLIETLRIIESKNLYDRARVFRRGYSFNKPDLVHVSGDGRYSSIVEAVIAERNKNRQEILRNPEAYYDRIEALRKRIEKNGIPDQISRLDELKELFDLELEKERKKDKKRD